MAPNNSTRLFLRTLSPEEKAAHNALEAHAKENIGEKQQANFMNIVRQLLIETRYYGDVPAETVQKRNTLLGAPTDMEAALAVVDGKKEERRSPIVQGHSTSLRDIPNGSRSGRGG